MYKISKSDEGKGFQICFQFLLSLLDGYHWNKEPGFSHWFRMTTYVKSNPCSQ